MFTSTIKTAQNNWQEKLMPNSIPEKP